MVRHPIPKRELFHQLSREDKMRASREAVQRLEIGKRIADELQPIRTKAEVAKALGMTEMGVAYTERMALYKLFAGLKGLNK